jgi:class 3 adenylate cyclase
MPAPFRSPLAPLEARLRLLLPPEVYAAAWLTPDAPTLTRVFEHLRTLQRVLYNYVPRRVSVAPPAPGQIRHDWQEGTLMFTDLAGFTSLLEANAAYGRAGAEALLDVLNSYFAQMIEIISKAGGDLLEFTGDAMLALFPADQRRADIAGADAPARDVLVAVRAGLRMQRAMASFANIAAAQGRFSLGMRVGLHRGRFLMADIGTPVRMENVLLGTAVQRTKQAESAGRVGRVCLSTETYARVASQFRAEPTDQGYLLLIDDLDDRALGEYDIAMGRRPASPLLLDRSLDGLLREIEQALCLVEPLAAYLPPPILGLLVQSAARRSIPPTFPELTAAFVNLLGLSEAVDRLPSGAEHALVANFSRLFAQIAAAVESRGGVLKNVTYHVSGPDMLIYFGVPNAHADDSLRAALCARAIRDIVAAAPPLEVGDALVPVACQIGVARGPAFVAEIGEPRGRREFNVLGDTVNTAARLMSRAGQNQILVTDTIRAAVEGELAATALPPVRLKGKAAPIPIFAL